MKEAVLLGLARLDRHCDGDATGGDVGKIGAESRHRALAGEARADARDSGIVERRRRRAQSIRHTRIIRIAASAEYLALPCTLCFYA
jgi:hypothetical protein